MASHHDSEEITTQQQQWQTEIVEPDPAAIS